MARWLTGTTDRGYEEIARRFRQMLEDGRHIFDASANALVGGTDPEAIRRDLFSTDQRINQTEQQIRRLIVVRGSVHGAKSFPSLLVMMSLVKDAERIGDYAKNIFDLASAKAELGSADERQRLVDLKDRVSRLLVKGPNVYESQDIGQARAFLAEADRVEDTCDAGLERLLKLRGENAAGRALALRYFKRVTSHVSNVVTSLVMPLDKLDFFDEPST
ncbi:MAG: hypothetical protein O7B99_00505 [Planctomycetota bacterium]|nr:hypothetical protein [Planctomycetota bacterium]